MYKTTQNSALQFAQQCADMAQQYTNFGFSVIPLTRGTKQPALSSWAEFQTKRPTLTEVQTWWDSGQQYGIAIVCGKVSGVVVLDIDDTDKFGVALNTIGETLPDTPIVRTRKGWHVYFKYPQNRIVRRHDRLSDWGAELRGDGCYVVAPPTEIDGHRYHWAKRNGKLMALGQVPLADCPEWLLDAFGVPLADQPERHELKTEQSPQPSQQTLTPEQRNAIKAVLLPHWHEGQRHELVLGLAGLLAKSGIAQDDALSLLREIAAEAQDNEWRDRERALKDTFDRLWKGEQVVGFKRLEEILGDQTTALIANIVRPQENKHKPKTVALLTLSEWDKKLTHITQGQWLVDRLLQAGWLLVLNARPKVGKSIVSVNLAVALANGTAFLNHKTSQCAVVYIDLERPIETLNRFKVLGVMESPNIFVPAERVGADLVDTLRDLINQAKVLTNRPVVVFVDTLGDFIKPALRQRKASINDYDAITEILQELRDLALELGCAFVFVHHTRKSQSDEPSEVDVLGSTAIAGKFDVIAHLQPDRTDAGVLSLAVEGNAITKTVLHFTIEGNFKLTPCEPPAKTKEEQAAREVLAYLRQHGQTKRKDLEAHLIEIGLADSQKTAEKLFDRASKLLEGQITREAKGRAALYTLSSEGNQGTGLQTSDIYIESVCGVCNHPNHRHHRQTNDVCNVCNPDELQTRQTNTIGMSVCLQSPSLTMDCQTSLTLSDEPVTPDFITQTLETQVTNPLPEIVDLEAFVTETENSPLDWQTSLLCSDQPIFPELVTSQTPDTKHRYSSYNNDTRKNPEKPTETATKTTTETIPKNAPEEVTDYTAFVTETFGEGTVLTEEWLRTLEDTTTSPENPPEKPRDIACLCGSPLRLVGQSYRCSNCNNPRPASCRKCGKVIQVNERGYAICVDCKTPHVFDAKRKVWLSDLDAF